MCAKFDFDTLRLQPTDKKGMYGSPDTLVNYMSIKTRMVMINNTTSQPVKLWEAYFVEDRTEKGFVMSVPPHTISFSVQNENFHIYFTDNKDKHLGGVQVGRKNGYVEIK